MRGPHRSLKPPHPGPLSPTAESSPKAISIVWERGQNLGKHLVEILHGVAYRGCGR